MSKIIWKRLFSLHFALTTAIIDLKKHESIAKEAGVEEDLAELLLLADKLRQKCFDYPMPGHRLTVSRRRQLTMEE